VFLKPDASSQEGALFLSATFIKFYLELWLPLIWYLNLLCLVATHFPTLIQGCKDSDINPWHHVGTWKSTQFFGTTAQHPMERMKWCDKIVIMPKAEGPWPHCLIYYWLICNSTPFYLDFHTMVPKLFNDSVPSAQFLSTQLLYPQYLQLLGYSYSFFFLGNESLLNPAACTNYHINFHQAPSIIICVVQEEFSKKIVHTVLFGRIIVQHPSNRQ
jgi:hypothetical protein